MAKQQVEQRFIFKINTKRLRKAKWNLTLPLSEARRNEEIIALSDSTMMRWIDELNGVCDFSERVRDIRFKINQLKRQPASVSSKHEIGKMYDKLDEIQFRPDYMHLVIDRDSDMRRACRGFKINGVKYVRLLGTNGGIKNSTVVFVSERLSSELRARIDNGHNHDVPQVPAKFEAYRALTCSGSAIVSMPKGVLLVNDCETSFKERVITLNDENDGDPNMAIIDGFDVSLDESDGYGLILPSLAERWSKEIGLDYVFSACNTRFSWEKGCVFCFDFIDFADKVAHSYIVKDAWGNDVDIRSVELVLTTSMIKLWKCYDSMEHYLACCAENHYSFGIPKVSPKKLEDKRDLNYQFIQSYELTDEQIEELIKPTLDDLKGALSMDYRKALIFLCGQNMDADSALRIDTSSVKALMANGEMFDDPYVGDMIHRMIRRRIDDAKIGVIGVHGNYSIACGDPYALCQSMFGLPVTGLLKAGELFNKYWIDSGSEYVACFRAPMSCHGNIKRMRVAHTDDMMYWYRYINTCTLFNAWDSTAQALNGMD